MNDNEMRIGINGHVLRLGDLRNILTLLGYTVERKAQRQSCITLNCHNDRKTGEFVGDLCQPCYEHVSTGSGRFSQAYRNAVRTATEILQLHLNNL